MRRADNKKAADEGRVLIGVAGGIFPPIVRL